MSLLERIGAAYEAISAGEGPLSLGLQAIETSTLANPASWLRSAFGGIPSASGKVITPDTSMRVAAVYACVRVLSQSVAQLPLKLFRKIEGGAEPAENHPLYQLLLNMPNPEMTAQDAREMAMNHLCLRGESYVQIVRAGGKVVELNPLHPDHVRIRRDDKNGQLLYDFNPPNGGDWTFKSNEVWRTIGMSFNGIQGVSPLTYAREAVGLSMATEEHGARLFVNGAQVATALESPNALTDAQFDRLEKQISEKYAGSRNAGRTMILENGLKASKLALTAEESQFLETRRFQIEEICRIYNVPPHKVQENSRSTFNNIEHLSMDFKNSSLAPYLVRFEQSGWRDLLLPSERSQYFLRHDTAQLDRGDTPALMNLIASGIANTWLNPNEGRAMFGLNPREGGDKYENPNTQSGATKPNTPVADPKEG